MSRDRLADIRGSQASSSFAPPSRGNSRSRMDIEMGNYPQQQHPSAGRPRRSTSGSDSGGGGYGGRGSGGGGGGSGNYLDEVGDLQRQMRAADEQIAQLADFQARIFASTRTAEQKDLNARFDALNEHIAASIAAIRNRVKQLYVKKRHHGQKDAHGRQLQQKSLAKQLQDIAGRYQQCQQQYKGAVRGRLEREYRIVNPTASREEIDSYVSNADGNPSVFSQAMMGRSQAMAAYKEVESRHQQIIRIEQQIEELVTVFQEMQVLLDAQQEQLDVIDTFVEETNTNLQQASSEMNKAIENRKKARKRAWCFCAICIVVLVILAIVLYLTVFKDMANKNNNNNNNGSKSSALTTATSNTVKLVRRMIAPVPRPDAPVVVVHDDGAE